MEHTAPPTLKSNARTRTLSLLALGLTASVFVWIGRTAYYAASDSFVAPSILSPDSDVVLANKLRFSELIVERARALAELESLESDLSAAEQAIARLEGLRETASKALRWTSELTSVKASTSEADLRALAEQKRVLEAMLERQADLARRARADVDAGLISRADYAREAQALTHIELSLIETGRATIQSKSTRYETKLAQRALARHGEAPSMPELIARNEQLVRLELEILRLQSEQRSKQAQKRALGERIGKIDELAAQLRSRPIFQATEKSLDVAFVPYTQIEGVEPGARVHSCVWGLFFCKDVGSVAELVPGEVILPDPWGSQARGQYAVLDLRDRASAMSKVLRVRGTTSAARAPAREVPDPATPDSRLSVR